MSIRSGFRSFLGRYGSLARTVAREVLGVVAPGSAALISLAEAAIHEASHVSEELEEGQWREQLARRLGQSEEEIARLSEMLGQLAGPLAGVCDAAQAKAEEPRESIRDAVRLALAEDESLSETLGEVQSLKEEFETFREDIRRIAERQRELEPIFERMNRIADFIDALREQHPDPEQFARLVKGHLDVAARIENGDVERAEVELSGLDEAVPFAVTVPVLRAAVATRRGDYEGARESLTRAVRIRPNDSGLNELVDRVTTIRNRTRAGSSTQAGADHGKHHHGSQSPHAVGVVEGEAEARACERHAHGGKSHHA